MSLRLVSRFALKTAVVIGCGASLVGAGTPAAAGPVAESLSCEVRQVVEQVRGAVVKVQGSDKTGQICGTGFFIDPNGTLLTSYSVGGESADLAVVLPNKHKIAARRIVADARAGIAMLKAEDVPPGTPFLPLASGSQLAAATPVVAVAFPMGMPLTPSFGFISGLDISYLGHCFATRHIRASVPVQRGEGGAPLLNMQGEVLGIVISSIDNGGACFAIPVAAVEKIRHDYERYGAVRPGWLGVVVKAVASGTAMAAEVESLETGSPAFHAGLKPGDRLVKIGETLIQSPEDVLDASFFLTAGEKVGMTVSRDGNELVFQARANDRHSGGGQIEEGQAIPNPPAFQGDITLRLNP